MSVQSEITRLTTAKAAIKTAIENKGVTVDDATTLDGMASLIEAIEAGGGGSVEPFSAVKTGSIAFTQAVSTLNVTTYFGWETLPAFFVICQTGAVSQSSSIQAACSVAMYNQMQRITLKSGSNSNLPTRRSPNFVFNAYSFEAGVIYWYLGAWE